MRGETILHMWLFTVRNWRNWQEGGQRTIYQGGSAALRANGREIRFESGRVFVSLCVCMIFLLAMSVGLGWERMIARQEIWETYG